MLVMIRTVGCILILIIMHGAFAEQTTFASHRNEVLEARISQLLTKLTLDEKVSLLSGISGFDTASIERLGIHGMTFSDGAHGVRSNDGDVATVYPVGMALASTWNVDLAQAEGKAIGEEAHEHDVQVMLGPNINLIRSPLAGRNFETFGEDPILTSRIGIGYVQGMQSVGVSATPKHFVANEQETERFRGSSNVDERTLHELYLVPFENVVHEAHPWSLMTAYNRVNGTFMTEHGDLLKQLLKKEWNFDGVVMSDWGAAHTLNVINNGLDLEMPGPARVFGDDLVHAVYYHQVSESVINEAVRRVLRLYARTGHLDPEQKKNANKLLHVAQSQEYNQVARHVAAEAITLLKNDKAVLPLDATKIKRLAVIGPNADTAIIQGSGSSQVLASEFVTPLQAIHALLPTNVQVSYESGVDNEWSPRVLDTRYFSPTRDRKQNGLLATYYANAKAAGKPVLSQVETNIGGMSFGGVVTTHGIKQLSTRWNGFFFAPLSGEYEFSLEHLDVHKGSHLAGDGVKVSVKMLIDKKIILGDHAPNSEYVTMTSLPTRAHATKVKLKAGQVYSFEISYSATGLSYHALRVGVRLPEGTIAAAVEAAQHADAAIVFVGSSSTTDSEGRDRVGIDLGFNQDELVTAVAAVNPHTVVVLNNGGPVAMPWINQVNAVLDAWLPGQEGPRAIADVLFGKVNPSGKLPVSFPKRLQDNPAYLYFPGKRVAHYGEGIFIGYRYYDKKEIEPLFPFGYGLSYTQFEYRNLHVTKKSKLSDDITVQVDIKNVGERAGAEVVELYVGDQDCREACPVRELKAFSKPMLQPGESRTLSFVLTPRDFSHYDIHANEWQEEEGEFEIGVGDSSRDLKLKANLSIGDE